MKVHDKIVELHSDCNLFARCAPMKGKRDIDMSRVVGDYELMHVPGSLMTPDGTLISGHTGKSDLVKEVMRSCKVATMLDLPSDDITCIVIDAMYVVNTITPKPAWIETGEDLAKEFLNRIDERSRNATTVAIDFDTYKDVSLKSVTRDDCVRKKEI